MLVLVALVALAPVSSVNAQWQTFERSGVIPRLGFEGADVRSVLTLIGEYGDVNIVFATQVSGQVTMQLRRVTWIEALEAVMMQLDLVSDPDTAVLVGGLPEGITFIEIMRRTDFNLREQQALQQQLDIVTSQPLDTQIIPLNHSQAAEIQLAIAPLGSPEGIIQIDTRSNRLIVRDYPDNLRLINEVIRALDVAVEQIRIEARLLEVDTDLMHEVGLDWSLNLTGTNPLQISTITNRVSDANIIGILGPFTGTDFSLDATIAAMEQQGIANVVATPSISVMDNVEGRVFMGEQIPLRTLDIAGNTRVEFRQVGTELIVTPHVVQGDKIILELAPKRESFRVDPAAGGVIVITQEASTTVLVNDGETAVIGGLKSESVQEADWGIPILMNIPIIGALFRFHRRQVQVRDLILFVTPHIQRASTVTVPPLR